MIASIRKSSTIKQESQRNEIKTDEKML